MYNIRLFSQVRSIMNWRIRRFFFLCGSLLNTLYLMTCREMTWFIIFISRAESSRELEARLILVTIQVLGLWLRVILTGTFLRNLLLELIVSTRAAQQTGGCISINLCSVISNAYTVSFFLESTLLSNLCFISFKWSKTSSTHFLMWSFFTLGDN